MSLTGQILLKPIPLPLLTEIGCALFHKDLICRLTKKQTQMSSPRLFTSATHDTAPRGTHTRSCIEPLVNWPVLIKLGF